MRRIAGAISFLSAERFLGRGRRRTAAEISFDLRRPFIRLLVLGSFFTEAGILLLQLRGKFGAEIFRLEDLADFDFRILVHWIWAALHPFDGLGEIFDLPDPEPGD